VESSSSPAPRKGRVTRATVARHAGVSTAVVSYVLNDGPRPVAESTRERVLRSIEVLGYRPDAVARALKTRRTHTIGLLVPDNSNPYFAELAKAIEDSAYARGYALLLGNSDNDRERENLQLAALRDRQVDGLLVIGTSADADLSDSRHDHTRVVLLDRIAGTLPYPSVVVDNRRGAYEGVRHLVRHGHERVLCIAGPGDVPAAVDREEGWRAAMSEAGLSTEELVIRTRFSRQEGYDAARAILTRTPRPTAIFASSDLQGIGVLRACYELALGVPRDIAVVAFDGTQESEFTSPPLTVIQQDIQTIAETGVSVLLSQEPAGQPAHVIAPCRLVIRSSCGCLHSSR
jgi:LacI family transcriptional regulator